MKEIIYNVRVEFGDCDPARIVWFPNFFRWIDAASRHFFVECGVPPWHETEQTLGIIIVMTVELGLITPPVGMNVFVIKSVVPDASFSTIFRGVAPFVFTDVLRLAVLVAFPVIALWLPARMG